MISQARSRSDAVSFIEGKAESIEMPGNSFDLVFTVDVIHHLDNQLQFIREAYRVLKPGGSLCTTTETEWDILRRQPFSNYFPESVDADLKRYVPISELRRMMEYAGFEQIHGENVSQNYTLDSIQAYRDKAFSCLHLISEESFQQGLERMESDLKTGPIRGISRYFLLWGVKICPSGGYWVIIGVILSENYISTGSCLGKLTFAVSQNRLSNSIEVGGFFYLSPTYRKADTGIMQCPIS